MYWQKKQIDYEILIPPIDKPIAEFNEDETDNYFNWFIEKIPERLDYLKFRCSKDLGIQENLIDLSPESLIIIWDWFLKIVEIEDNPNYNPGMFVSISNKQLTLESEYIIRDIAMYVGETFIKNVNGIKWSYNKPPVMDVNDNMPLLSGFIFKNCKPLIKTTQKIKNFQEVFEPISMVRVQALKILDNIQSRNDLYNLYLIWLELNS